MLVIWGIEKGTNGRELSQSGFTDCRFMHVEIFALFMLMKQVLENVLL